MQRFEGRVAVITGAASGIGLGLARHCAREGMKVVLADIEEGALSAAEADLRGKGAAVLGVVTDVSDARSVERLAETTIERFGAVHLLCNNAGVGVIRTVWESTLADWQWVLGVNLWGVIHGLRVFVPLMLQQETECHIVNTSSIAGLVVAPGSSSPYNVSKHGVVALTETLHYELAERNARVKVSVLCPGWVDTRIADAERNRPPELRDAPPDRAAQIADAAARRSVRRATRLGLSPDEVAEIVFQAIREEQLYIFTDPESKEWVRAHFEAVLGDMAPPRAGD